MIDVTFYHLAGKLVKDLIEGKGTVNSLCLHDSIRQKKRMVALVSETFKYRTLLNQIMEAANLSSCYKNKKNPDRLPYHVVLVVLYEFLWGVVIASSSSSSKKTLSEMEAKNAFIQAFPSLSLHKTRIRAEWTKLSLKLAIRHPRETLSSELALLEDIPKYARVNTLKASSCQEVMALLEQEGFVDLTSFLTQQDKPLKWFKKDDLIPNLLLFPSKGISFYKHKFVKNGWLIFQDKASCLPAFVLSPPPGAVVLDACAAPGNKTSHLASLMNNQGVIYAIEKDSTRFDTMNQLLERAGASCVKPLNLDFLRIDPLSEPFQQVQYILLDPSCSGSGMLSRLDSFVKGTEEEEFKKEQDLPERLRNLSNFQFHALMHAFKFPNLKELVYSTCSVHEIENEGVIKRALEALQHDDDAKSKTFSFRLQRHILPEWKRRGLDGAMEGSEHMIRADPKQDQCHGFFVAKFERYVPERCHPATKRILADDIKGSKKKKYER